MLKMKSALSIVAIFSLALGSCVKHIPEKEMPNVDNGAITMSGEFTATGHTDANVRTFAIGYGAEYFHNKTIDNTDIAKFAINAVSN